MLGRCGLHSSAAPLSCAVQHGVLLSTQFFYLLRGGVCKSSLPRLPPLVGNARAVGKARAVALQLPQALTSGGSCRCVDPMHFSA